MTRYGFAIKALPKGGKPFGDDEEDDQPEEAPEPGPDAASGPPKPPADAGGPLDDAADPAADSAELLGEEDPAAPPGEAGAGPPTDDMEAPPQPPADDARLWSGEVYDEGDETDPAAAFAAYTGSQGEEAWLDQAPDGTLTGWVRDSTGQVWLYSDAETWAIDVDDAQMTRTHSRAETDDAGTAPASDRGEQEPMFPPQ
ncbi:hypothetical protein ACIHCQ_41315 [Streptomyces sp. NPDC052236]|uniref:hypothetical protein n=1 Tax=Streptomyces sp. NPDC052236 TaxID=3365686 RepID=UPI0037CEF66F